MTQPTERRHLTPEQAATLDGFEAWRKWREARGLRVWDQVDCDMYRDKPPFIACEIDEDGDLWLWNQAHECVGHEKPIACRLLASESDLWDFAESAGVRNLDLCRDGDGIYHIHAWGWLPMVSVEVEAPTRLDALFEAVVGALKGGE